MEGSGVMKRWNYLAPPSWQAETSTIILDIPGIQAKEHHTAEELRSLTLEALSVAYPSTTWARAYTDGSAEEAAKKWRRWSFHQAPWWQIHQEVCGYRAAVNKLQSWSLRLACSKTLNQEERPPTNTVFLTYCQFILQSLQLPGEDQIFSNIRQELSLLTNKTSLTLQSIPSLCGVGGNEEADQLSKIGSKLEQSAHPMSYSETKTSLRNNFRMESQHAIIIIIIIISWSSVLM